MIRRMRKTLIVYFLVAAAPVLFTKSAWAERDILVNIRARAEPGSPDGPALLITPNKEVRDLSVHLTRRCEDGDREEVTLRPTMKTGQRNEVALPHPAGRFSWEGTLSVRFADGSEGDMPLSFETARVGAMRISSEATREDVMARRVVMRADRPVHKASVEVTGDGGKQLAAKEIDFDGAPANSDLTIEWEQEEEGDPLVVEVRLYAEDGSWRGVRWMPWEVKIPHETVEFATGQARIPKDEAHKLEGVLGKLNSALERYGEVVDVSLWIAGHTDTVGSRESNIRLSHARAKAIGTWFRRSGVTVPIHYRGFGQESLRVSTPDNTEEPRNRRAEYVVAAEDPYAGRDLPGRWQKLP